MGRRELVAAVVQQVARYVAQRREARPSGALGPGHAAPQREVPRYGEPERRRAAGEPERRHAAPGRHVDPCLRHPGLGPPFGPASATFTRAVEVSNNAVRTKTAGDRIAGSLSYNGNNGQRLAERAVPEIELDQAWNTVRLGMLCPADAILRLVEWVDSSCNSDPGNDRRSDRARQEIIRWAVASPS